MPLGIASLPSYPSWSVGLSKGKEWQGPLSIIKEAVKTAFLHAVKTTIFSNF